MAERIKPRLTLKLVAFMLIDCLGMALFSIGVASLKSGGPVLLRDFPTTPLEAIVTLIIGIAIMIFGTGQVMGEIARQNPKD